MRGNERVREGERWEREEEKDRDKRKKEIEVLQVRK